ncbi:MAG: hypothetical protein QNK23_12080 [Crocinitomicaceae bacterium]|nr:hypothetical protein [Crocinitomicaceae bacterium]
MKSLVILGLSILNSIFLFAQEEQLKWSSPINGLEACLTFDIEYSEIHTNVIHPELNLRNVTNDPIHFFWCVYDAGNFVIRDTKRNLVQETPPFHRSGPIGAEVLTIEPGQIIQVDAYDYGYGQKQDPDLFYFHTSSEQYSLKRDSYFVDYTLTYTSENLEKYLNHYHWIESDPSTLWTGKIKLNEVPLDVR